MVVWDWEYCCELCAVVTCTGTVMLMLKLMQWALMLGMLWWDETATYNVTSVYCRRHRHHHRHGHNLLPVFVLWWQIMTLMTSVITWLPTEKVLGSVCLCEWAKPCSNSWASCYFCCCFRNILQVLTVYLDTRSENLWRLILYTSHSTDNHHHQKHL